MGFSVSIDSRIITGTVSPALLDLAGQEYKLFDGAEFRGEYRGREFYSCIFVNSGLKGTFVDVNFNDCKFVNCNVASGLYRNADFTGSKFVDTAITENFVNSVKGVNSPIIPDGDLIVYKSGRNGTLITLRIPAGAKRSTAGMGKCRAEYAIVLSIVDRNDKPVEVAYSQHDSLFEYKVGALVRPMSPFDENPWRECASGIHFFYTQAEARNWGY